MSEMIDVGYREGVIHPSDFLFQKRNAVKSIVPACLPHTECRIGLLQGNKSMAVAATSLLSAPERGAARPADWEGSWGLNLFRFAQNVGI